MRNSPKRRKTRFFFRFISRLRAKETTNRHNPLYQTNPKADTNSNKSPIKHNKQDLYSFIPEKAKTDEPFKSNKKICIVRSGGHNGLVFNDNLLYKLHWKHDGCMRRLVKNEFFKRR